MNERLSSVSKRTRIGIGLGALLLLCGMCATCLPKTAPKSAGTGATAPAPTEPASVSDTATDEPQATATDGPTAEPPTAKPLPATAEPRTEAPLSTASPVPVEPTAAPVLQDAAPPPASDVAPASGCVNFNGAGLDDLKRIINVDDDIAGQIISLRAERPFSGWPDLVSRVKGIGDNNVKDIQAQGVGCF